MANPADLHGAEINRENVERGLCRPLQGADEVSGVAIRSNLRILNGRGEDAESAGPG